jgi:hypothetical protein
MWKNELRDLPLLGQLSGSGATTGGHVQQATLSGEIQLLRQLLTLTKTNNLRPFPRQPHCRKVSFSDISTMR